MNNASLSPNAAYDSGNASAKNRSRLAKAAGIVVALLAVFGIGSYVADRAILAQTYARYPVAQPNLLATYDDYADEYDREAVEFQLDGATLRGYVYGPQNTRGLIIFRHGIFSQHQDYLPLITAMVDRGWRVFAYDAIGCGESDGDSVIGFSQSPRDVAAAIDFAKDSGMAEGMKLALWGHSWGGYGVAAALSLRSDVDACVTMSGFDTPLGILETGAESMMGPLAATQLPTMWLGMLVDFGFDANRSASEAITESGVQTYVVHGENDEVVPYAGASIMSHFVDSGNNGTDGTVSTLALAEPGRSGHNTYFYSPESQQYLGECAAALEQLLNENEDDPAAPEVATFLEGMDRLRANTADPTLIDQIDRFLAMALGV